MKKIIYATLLTTALTLVFGVVYYHKYNTASPFRCAAQFEQTSYDKTSHGGQVQVNASVTLFVSDNKNGFFSMAGTVEARGENYNLRRNANFSLAPNALNGVRKAVINSEKSYPVDNTPNDIWVNSITPQKIGEDFYVGIKNINKNTLEISSLSFPYLICVKQED
ncbi:hypothetical protein [Serratia quinivorans]|uniref:hypothetical protein n=1 Tax=Serratia quinivorans TaxID=137545 RepID=UPI0021770FE9|nr:hypothetical protein [Serratia quinivorans]CAI0696460.1 Uncharacterised protein [Serratia quinivorans]